MMSPANWPAWRKQLMLPRSSQPWNNPTKVRQLRGSHAGDSHAGSRTDSHTRRCAEPDSVAGMLGGPCQRKCFRTLQIGMHLLVRRIVCLPAADVRQQWPYKLSRAHGRALLTRCIRPTVVALQPSAYVRQREVVNGKLGHHLDRPCGESCEVTKMDTPRPAALADLLLRRGRAWPTPCGVEA